jgi:hypothetical protein
MGYTTHTPSGFTIDVTLESTRSTPHQHRTITSSTPHHRRYREGKEKVKIGRRAALKNTPVSSARFNALGIFLIQYIGSYRGVSFHGTVINTFSNHYGVE